MHAHLCSELSHLENTSQLYGGLHKHLAMLPLSPSG